jgi:hypothetical protein
MVASAVLTALAILPAPRTEALHAAPSMTTVLSCR